MYRPIFRLYLMILIAAALTMFAMSESFVWIFHDTITEGHRENRKGYVYLLQQYIEHAKQEGTTQESIARLNHHALEKFSILDPQTISGLSERQVKDLAAGNLVLKPNGEDYYVPLKDGVVLQMVVDDVNYSGIKAIALSLVALATLLPIIYWIWLHWRDLGKLEDSARRFGAGDLNTRARLHPNSNIATLALQFNSMAERIQGSITHQREMMNGISHELKTPIARLQFGIALLQSQMATEKSSLRLQALLGDVRELDELVSEILELSRLEQDASYVALMTVDVQEWLDSVVASVVHDAAERNIELHVDTEAAPDELVCDPRLVARALLNLMRNACRYAARQVAVHAEATPLGGLRLVVEDDGPGIPEEDRGRVFEPFVRVDTSRDRETGRFGLGLAIARRIAMVHEGSVEVGDATIGGARFSIELPAR